MAQIRLNLTFAEICAALESAIDRVGGKPHINSTVELKGMAVYVLDVAAALKGWDLPVPPTLLTKLDLAPGTTADDVAAAIIAIYNAPMVMTREAEAKMEAQLSEARTLAAADALLNRGKA